ncbi:MAG: hypothetical protein JNK05_10545 [Myxococcales bacterium]|nr:hypothetical protein [Myxococcales bacterium]
MRRTHWNSLLALAVFALASSACRQQNSTTFEFVGQDTMTGRQVTVRQGPMPDGEVFSGFYRSQLMGDINMQQTGDAVVADYEYDRAQCHVLGHLEGTVVGNVLRFAWREDKRACGFQTPITGRGYMLYDVSQEGEVRRGHLYGQIGLGDSDRGDGELAAVKVPGREPQMRSQQSSGGEGSGEGSGSGDGSGSGSGSGS